MRKSVLIGCSLLAVSIYTPSFGEGLGDLPPLSPLAPIAPLAPIETDRLVEPVTPITPPDTGKQYILPERRANANGTYIDEDSNLHRVEGGDHLKTMDDLNTNDRHSCMVIGDILDCN